MRMRLIPFCVIFAVGISLATPVSENGQLSVSNGVLVNKNNSAYQLRGMSLFWSQWYGNFYNQNVVNTLASTNSTGWGGSVIRAAIADKNVSLTKSMIDWAIAAGVYIIVDNHSHCAHTETSAVASYFSTISSYVKQKGNPPNVIYEIYNEPLYQNCTSGTDASSGGTLTSWSTIKSFAETVIAAIRANDANNIIIVGTPNYSQNTEAARANPITSYRNIMYALHFYASTSGHASLKYNLLRGKCYNFPIFISEWGTSESTGDGTVSIDMNNSWMSWVETLGVSWANWSIVDKGESSGALVSGAGSGGYWSDSQLSKSGSYVRKIMKGRNAGGNLASVGLSESNTDCSLLEGGQPAEFIRTGVGIFGYNIQGENYADSLNIRTVEDANVQNGMYVTGVTTDAAVTKYAVMEIPGPGTYMLYSRISALSAGSVTYDVDGVVTGSYNYEATGSLSTTKLSSTTIYMPTEGTSTVTFSFPSSVALDMFVITYADSLDSITYGITAIHQKSLNLSAGTFDFDQHSRTFILPNSSFDEIVMYSLNGIKLKSMNVRGRTSVPLEAMMPNGIYMVVLKGKSQQHYLRVSLIN